MARDTFIKFGEAKEKDWHERPFPLIEGDSSDDEHFFWTEVLSCDFGMTPYEEDPAAAAAPAGADASHQEKAKQTRAELGLVSITKKVDWGSADLFRLCCQAPAALQIKVKPESDMGQLETVIIEVCRRSGVDSEGRVPFLTIKYSGVYIVSYQIEFGGNEPREKLKFQYSRLEFKYIWMNPSTGGIAGDVSANTMVNHPKPSVTTVETTETGDSSSTTEGSTGIASNLEMPDPNQQVMSSNS